VIFVNIIAQWSAESEVQEEGAKWVGKLKMRPVGDFPWLQSVLTVFLSIFLHAVWH